MNKIFISVAEWMFSLLIVAIFFGGVLYCVLQMQGVSTLKEALFWSSIVLLFMGQIFRALSGLFTSKKEGDKK